MALMIICAVGFAVCSGLAALFGKALKTTFEDCGHEMFKSLKDSMK